MKLMLTVADRTAQNRVHTCGWCGHSRRTRYIRGGVLHIAYADEESWAEGNEWRRASFPRLNTAWANTSFEEHMILKFTQHGPIQAGCGAGVGWGLQPATDEEVMALPLCKSCMSIQQRSGLLGFGW